VTLASAVLDSIQRGKQKSIEKQALVRQRFVREQQEKIRAKYASGGIPVAELDQLSGWERQQEQNENQLIESSTSVSVGYETNDGRVISGPDPRIYMDQEFPTNPRAILMNGQVLSWIGGSITVILRNAPYVDLSCSVEGREEEWASTTFELISSRVKAKESPVFSFFRRPTTLALVGALFWFVFAYQIGRLFIFLPFPLLRESPWLSVILALLPLQIISLTYNYLTPAFNIVAATSAIVYDLLRTAITAGVGALISLIFHLLRQWLSV
jgi:hypothetical protein